MSILAVVLIIISAALITAAVFSFKCRGFLFNNSYIFATDEERKKMDKKPYYRQTGVVFVLIAAIMMLNAVQILTGLSRIFYITMAVSGFTVIYAVISSIKIEKNNKS